MRAHNLLKLALASSLLPTVCLADSLPIGEVKESKKKAKFVAPVEVSNCVKWFSNPMGMTGSLDYENDIYEQFYLKEVGKKKTFVYEQINLETLEQKNKVSLKLPKVDQAIFPRPDEGDGIILVNYKDNRDKCYDGTASYTAISLEKVPGKKRAVTILKDKGRYTSYALGSGFALVDRAKNEIIRNHFSPLVKKYSKYEFKQKERILYADNLSLKKGFVAVMEEGKRRTLFKYGENNAILHRLELQPGDRISRNYGNFAITRASDTKQKIALLEDKSWTDADETKVYNIEVPKGLLVSRSLLVPSSKSGIAFLAADTKFFRNRWNEVHVIDYRQGKTLSRLKVPKGQIPGDIHLSRDGKVGIVEVVDAKSGVRKALNIFKLSKLEWKKIQY